MSTLAAARGHLKALLRAGIAAELVQRAAAARDVDPRLALRLGIAADRIHPDTHTRAGLVDTLTSTRYRGQLTGGAPAFDPRRPVAATIDYSGTTTLWDVSAAGPGLRTEAVRAVAFSADGAAYASSGDERTTQVFDVEGDKPDGLPGQLQTRCHER